MGAGVGVGHGIVVGAWIAVFPRHQIILLRPRLQTVPSRVLVAAPFPAVLLSRERFGGHASVGRWLTSQ